MLYLGIDPGASGACAWCGDGTKPGFFTFDDTERDTWDGFADLVRGRHTRSAVPRVCALIEHVHSMPGQGVASSFKFGMSYGGLRMALIGNLIPFESITPTQWQKQLGLGGRYPSKTARKNAHKAKAQELFPHLKITHKNADALLLAEVCRRTK